MKQNYDLHIHSTFSDGLLTPSEIAQTAFNKGLTAFSITDHDTVDGVEEGMKKASELGIKCISGIEVSAFEGNEIHVLGYNVDHKSPLLLNKLAELQALRKERNYEIIRKLHAHGVKLKVGDEFEDGSKGRALIANMLVEQGFVRTRVEAFDKYIGAKAPCYVGKLRISPEDAISLINSSEGVAVLAHPYRYLKDGNINDFVKRLTAAGLKGIEVCYPNYGVDVRRELRKIAQNNGLFCTGGSDHHSPNYGFGIGDVNVYLDNFALSSLGLAD